MATLVQPSLDALYRSHGEWLRSWLTARSRCSIQANDIAQETFCRLAAQPEVRLHSYPRRYLATVARRLLIDDVRRRATERSVLEAFALHMGDAVEIGPDRLAEAVQQLSAVVSLLAELPEKPRRAFLLSRVDGLSYREIATELGVSTSMVKQYVARAFAHCYAVAHGHPD